MNAGNRAGVFVVLSSQVVNQQCFNTLDSVPRFQTFKPQLDGMIASVIRHFGYGNVEVSVGKTAVVILQVAHQMCIIHISPESPGMFPWNIPHDLKVICQLIEPDTLEILIPGKDQPEVVGAVLQLGTATFVFKFLFPLIVAFNFRICEVALCLRYTFIGKSHPHFILLHGKIAHCLEGRLFVEILE